MDQLSAMRAFARVVETGNFTRAATTLSMPKATVTTLIQALELHLHTKLLNRTTRRVMVTTDGALYYERAIQILSEIEELDGSVSSSQSTCAAPLYIQKFGIPERPEDIEEGHFAVSYFRAQTGKTVPFEFKRGNEAVEVNPRYIVSVNDSRSYVSAAMTGLGIVQAPSFMIREALAEGKLVPILSDWQRSPLPLHIVYPPNRHLSNKVRVFVDWLAKLLVTSKVGDM
jgi:DNA-binding transcriptional LysR family regulator